MNSKLKPKIDEIIDLLSSKYGVKAIILCGSRAVGDYDPESDRDMFAFSDLMKKGETSKELIDRLGVPEIPGEYLQVVFYPITQAYSWNIFGLKLRFSEIIFDTEDGLAKKIREDAFKVYDKGPEKWTNVYALARKDKSQGYIKKCERLLKQNKQGELFLRICWNFAENVIDWWFGIRQEWPLRPQQTFDYIKEKDIEYYKQLERVFNNTSNKEKVEAFKEIHKCLFESKDYLELVK